MNNKHEDSEQTAADAAVLRKRAEEQARSYGVAALSAQTPEEIQRVFHELQVHQIELETQNADLRRAQVEIDAGRERYINLYDLAPVGYCTLSEKGLILEANLTAATLLGTARSALVKQPISRFILKEDQDIYYLYRKQLFETGEPQECELRLVKPDGAIFWAHLTATAAQAEDGARVCRVVISDITERKQAEDELLKSEEKYRGLIEGLNDAVYRMTLPEGRYEYFSPSAKDVFGYASEEFVSNPLLIQRIIHPDFAGYFEDQWKELLEGNVPERYEYRVIDPDGNERWIVQSNKAMFDDSGKIMAIEGLCQNVTERKQAEDELRRLEERHERLAADSRTIAWEVDTAGLYTYVSPVVQDVLGYRQEEIVGKLHFYDLQRGEGRAAFKKKVFSAMPRKEAFVNLDSALVCKDGSVVWVTTNARPILGVDGSLKGYRGSDKDITERKRAEDNLRESEFRFHRMLSLVPDMISIHDTDMNIVYSNWNGFGAVPEERQNLKTKCYMTYRGYDDICPDCCAKTVLETRKPFQAEKQLPDGRWVDLHAIPFLDEMGDVDLFVEWVRDITERKEAEDQIRFQADIIENAPVIVAYHDKNLDVVWANRAYREATGLSLEEVRAKQCWKVWNLSGPCRGCPVITAIETGESAANELTPDNQDHWPETQGSWLCQAAPVRDEQGAVIGAVEFAIDITERKRADTHREMGQEILQILNEPGDLQESIQRVLAALKTRTGVDAVGLRLQEGEDFPYFVQDGFSQDFLRTENTLVERDKDGGECRDEDGNVFLEGTCGLVISGKTDPSNPLFTQGGSFWTNESFPLLDLPPDQDPRLHPRNNCIHQGYASVALIPVRASDRIMGLIQLNDKRKGRFALETIQALEGIASHIGAALMRKRAEQTLRDREDEARRSAARLQLVGDVGARILIRVRLDAVGQAVYEQCKELMPVDAFWIGLLDKRTDRISFPFGFKDGERRSPPERSMEESPGLFGHVLKLGSTLYVSDMPNSALAATWVVQPGSRTRSAVCVPFVLDENACGVFSVQSNEPDVYTQEQVEILGLLSAQIVLAIANTRTHEATQRGLESTLTALSHVAEKRDPYTAGHQERVTTLALAIARRLGLGHDEQNTLRIAGMLHDIGKISVPTEILSKPGTLNDLEFRMIQEHPQAGYDILVDSDFPGPVAEIVYSHHERLDGTGYPRKLSGDDISLEARILAVADTVEAMTSHRPYRPALGIEAACAEIRRGRGTAYGADAVDACLAIVQSEEFSFDTLTQATGRTVTICKKTQPTSRSSPAESNSAPTISGSSSVSG